MHVETPNALIPPYHQQISPNHGPMNRLLWIPGRKNNYSPGRFTSKAEDDNAIQSVQEIRGIRTGESTRLSTRNWSL